MDTKQQIDFFEEVARRQKSNRRAVYLGKDLLPLT